MSPTRPGWSGNASESTHGDFGYRCSYITHAMKSLLLALFLCLFALACGISAMEWDFTAPRDFEQVSTPKHLTATASADGLLLEVSGADSCVGLYHLSLDPKEFGRVEIEYRATGFAGGTTGQLFFASDAADAMATSALLANVVCILRISVLLSAGSIRSSPCKVWPPVDRARHGRRFFRRCRCRHVERCRSASGTRKALLFDRAAGEPRRCRGDGRELALTCTPT